MLVAIFIRVEVDERKPAAGVALVTAQRVAHDFRKGGARSPGDRLFGQAEPRVKIKSVGLRFVLLWNPLTQAEGGAQPKSGVLS